MTTKRTGRPAVGSVFFEGGRWKVRVTTNAGRRPVLPVCDVGALAEDDTQRAEKAGAEIAREVRETGWEPGQDAPAAIVATRRDETVSQWFARWDEDRDHKLERARCNRADFRKWIEPIIGHFAIATLKRSDVERVVRHLDAAVVRSDIRWKTARNVWGTLSKMMRDCCRSKQPALRVRDDNPASNVEGPDRGVNRSGPYLYPTELTKLVVNAVIPIARRRLYALAVYTGLRRGELAALRWEDVDLDAGNILVHRAEDFDTGEEKSTKTKQTRRVPIEPHLRPMLEAMRGKAKEHVIGMETHLPRLLRADLARVGCTRPELTANDDTRRPLDFHDLRHTYGTWRAIRGDDAMKIQRGMGHAALEMTQMYINDAETFDPNFGAGVFGPLPDALLSSGSVSAADESPQETSSGCWTRKSDDAADVSDSAKKHTEPRPEPGPIQDFRHDFSQPSGESNAVHALALAVSDLTRLLTVALERGDSKTVEVAREQLAHLRVIKGGRS